MHDIRTKSFRWLSKSWSFSAFCLYGLGNVTNNNRAPCTDEVTLKIKEKLLPRNIGLDISTTCTWVCLMPGI